jgi:hypothetical protein
LPSRSLRTVGGNVQGLLRFDAALVHALDAAGSSTQRAVAVLAARRACAAAGLDRLDWIAAGLTALAEGRPLPPPFGDADRVWRALESDPRVPDRAVAEAVPPERPPFQPPGDDSTRERMRGCGSMPRIPGILARATKPPSPPEPPPSAEATWYAHTAAIGAPNPAMRMSQPHMAIPALLGAAEPDPLRAALDAVFAAVITHGESYHAFLQEVWSACQERPKAP